MSVRPSGAHRMASSSAAVVSARVRGLVAASADASARRCASVPRARALSRAFATTGQVAASVPYPVVGNPARCRCTVVRADASRSSVRVSDFVAAEIALQMAGTCSWGTRRESSAPASARKS